MAPVNDGASDEKHGLVSHGPVYHDLQGDAQTGVPGGCHREGNSVWKIPVTEYNLPRV